MTIEAVAWMYEETLARPFVVSPPKDSPRRNAAPETRRAAVSAEATDEALMLSVARGDEAAFRNLAARHAARTLALSRRMLANPADAEEIVQEAMLRVWVNAPRWRAEAAFKTWLYRVVVNLCLNRQRQKTFAPLDDAAVVPDPSPSAQASLERREADAAVARAIADLPDRQRAAIVLTYYEDLSNAEAASVLEASVSSVEALLVRAKRTLRDALRPQSDDLTSGSRP
ncbi:RNA polymerase sigma factor [Rhodomicrobium sp. Az07]|uniref:RNA polymerase sigma factor n=1 Tax=Rhodomicrobium sp. Az07 TaxID=2839034 RepID=UPI001BE67C7A|nr:RNA polymerase sigma factor [Rhodomicrobium sp. Az07]